MPVGSSLFFLRWEEWKGKGRTRAGKTFYIFFWVITPYLFSWTEQEEEREQTGRILGFYSLSYNHHIMFFPPQLGGSRFLFLFCASPFVIIIMALLLVHTVYLFFLLFVLAGFSFSFLFSSSSITLVVVVFTFQLGLSLGFLRMEWNDGGMDGMGLSYRIGKKSIRFE